MALELPYKGQQVWTPIIKLLNSLVLRSTTQNEIECIIMGLQSKTSCGYDKISNNLLKNLFRCLSYLLLIIFNQSISECVFPDLMKIAEVIPLYKANDRDAIINYQPISLLICMSKVFEKIMYQRVYTFLDLHGVLYQSQYGFRNKHSCSQAISELTGKILQAKEAGIHSSSIVLHLSKVFDTLDHRVLLQKLDRYGIRGNANKWFSSYLSNRSLTARIQTKLDTITYLESFDTTYRTAQGSCLGLLLFIIFCNDIKLLPLFGSLILFADDTTQTNSHKSESFLQYSLIHDMGLLMDWFNVT